MIYALTFPLLAAVIGYLLGIAAKRWHVAGDPLVDTITEMLPNAQCGQCGFPGCAQAAKALVAGEIQPDFCPPGGNLLARQLAEKLDIPLSQDALSTPQVAAINVERCDGCGRCFKACPFDAIVGAPRQLHGVVPEACVGCGQCVDVCPHSGIELKADPIVLGVSAKPSLKPATTGRLGVANA